MLGEVPEVRGAGADGGGERSEGTGDSPHPAPTAATTSASASLTTERRRRSSRRDACNRVRSAPGSPVLRGRGGSPPATAPRRCRQGCAPARPGAMGGPEARLAGAGSAAPVEERRDRGRAVRLDRGGEEGESGSGLHGAGQER